MGADYIYATACIRAEECKLLTGEKLRAMTESKNIDDICKVLQDAGYGTESDPLTPANYAQVVKNTEAEIFQNVKTLSKENEIFSIFSFPADYHNIKVLLKAEALGVNRNDILMATGTVPAEEMIRAVTERDMTELTENMAAAIEEAAETHARTKDPQVIDFICDRFCYMDICRVAEKAGNEFVSGYVRLLIDTVNLKTFARIRKMGQPWSYLESVFVPGGNVDLQVFTGAYEEDYKQASSRFEAYKIYRAVSEGGEEIDEKGSFTKLEKLCDDILIEQVREARGITFGIEPLVAFLISRQMEIKCIRILMTGKLAGMDPQIIRERMRETYE